MHIGYQRVADSVIFSYNYILDLWEAMLVRRGTWGLEDRKCHPSLQKEKEQPRHLPVSQPYLRPWKGHGAPHSEMKASLSTWMTRKCSGLVSLDSLKGSHAYQSDCLLQRSNDIDEWGKSSWCCSTLTSFQISLAERTVEINSSCSVHPAYRCQF